MDVLFVVSILAMLAGWIPWWSPLVVIAVVVLDVLL